MRNDTADPTSPENIDSGNPVQWYLPQRKGWPHSLGQRRVITNLRDLAEELIRRVDINRELYRAGMEPTQEDRESLRFLCCQWDRLRLLRARRIPQRTTGGLAREQANRSKRRNGPTPIPQQHNVNRENQPKDATE